jgi:hypothetical protein
VEARKARRRVEGRHEGATVGGGSSCGVVVVGTRAAAVGIGRGGGSGSVKEEREGRRVGERQGRREEAKGRGRQWNRVWDPFIQSKHNFIHPFTDERSKRIGLFGSKRDSYISPLLNFFLFPFSFLCNKKIITI